MAISLFCELPVSASRLFPRSRRFREKSETPYSGVDNLALTTMHEFGIDKLRFMP